MNNIDTAFAKMFESWNIHLPLNATTLKQPGKIVQAGWAIRYVFGEDYLDYYAEHRMTNPRHERIHSDGRCESLEAPSNNVEAIRSFDHQDVGTLYFVWQNESGSDRAVSSAG